MDKVRNAKILLILFLPVFVWTMGIRKNEPRDMINAFLLKYNLLKRMMNAKIFSEPDKRCEAMCFEE